MSTADGNFPGWRRRVEQYAFRHKVSFNEAKRRVRGRKEDNHDVPVRGVAVPGTGKPKGGSKT